MKYSDTNPQAMPKSMFDGTRFTTQGSSSVKVNSFASPTRTYVKLVAVTDAISIGDIDAIVRSIISTSMVKTSPAIGALKMPAIAAAAPHPTSNISVLLFIRNSCPRLLAIAEPVSTIGASAPTEPPKPIVTAEATTEDQQLWAFSRERFEEMAYSIRVIPCEILSRTT